MNKIRKLIKVLAYIRYSSHNQDDGCSVAAQIACIDRYCSGNGMEVEEYYIDMAKTGRNTNRPEYKRMMADVQTGTVEARTIIFRDFDRHHRSLLNEAKDLEWCEKNNVRIISIQDGIDTAKNPNKFEIYMRAAMAEAFSEKLSQNTRSAMLTLAKEGRHLGGVPPIGYKVNAEGFYEIDELKAQIVREIYKLYLQDMGYDYIIRYMKEQGYKTNAGKDFTKSSLNGILKNPKYMGTYVYDRSAPKDSEGKRNSRVKKATYIQLKDKMPAIISPEDFQKVQEKMAEKKLQFQHRAGKHYYPLNGKLRCAKCGKAFTGNVSKCKGKNYFSYKATCQCGIKPVKMEQLNAFVFYAVQQCVFSPENKDKIISRMSAKLALQGALQSAEVSELTNQINGLENAQNNLTGYLEDGRATQTILDKLEKNEAKLAILRTRLAAKMKMESTVDASAYDSLVRQFLGYMSTEKTPEAYALRDSVIDYIDIDTDAVAVHFNNGTTADNDTICYFNMQEVSK